jgi:histidine triad (HIT) family protein
MDCIFCEIISGNIPADIVHKDDKVIAFRDIKPQAKTHIIIIPNKHIASLNDLTKEDSTLIGHMVLVAGKLAEKEGVSQSGYRLAINCGVEGGQLVPHLHLHLVGGRKLADELG